MSVNQTVAIFKDAYREINSKKMFWISMGLTGLAVVAFAILGVGKEGVTLLWYTVAPMEPERAEVAYKMVFSYLVVGFWLTWAATILALVSTSFIFPDFLSAGSIDLYMSKPIGRWRLFLTKYAAGLLFVVLQVTVFCVGSFVVLGLRGGVWKPGLFWGIPIVVCFFSYLYAFSVLFGVWTRSTIAAVLLTILVWGGLFGIHKAEEFTLMMTRVQEAMSKGGEVAMIDLQVNRLKATAMPAEQKEKLLDEYAMRREEAVERTKAASGENEGRAMRRIHGVLMGIKTVVPKTAETTGLMDRILFTDEEMKGDGDGREMRRAAGQEALTTELRSRSVWWIVGTSLLFEALVVGLAGWIFVRRDY